MKTKKHMIFLEIEIPTGFYCESCRFNGVTDAGSGLCYLFDELIIENSTTCGDCRIAECMEMFGEEDEA